MIKNWASLNFLQLYRITPHNNKASSLRPLGYFLFGYGLTWKGETLGQFTLYAISLVGVLAFIYFLNDYYDWKLNQESNTLLDNLQSKPSSKNYLIYLLLPLLVFGVSTSLSLVIYSITPSAILITIILLLATIYSLPPIRLKEIRGGFLTTVAIAVLLFFSGVLIEGTITAPVLALAVIIFIYQIYLEFLHLLQDSLDPTETRRWNQEKLVRYIWLAPLISLLVSIALAILLTPVFFITALFALIRIREAYNIKPERVYQKRNNLFSPLLSLYEFPLYLVYFQL